jgi:maltose alpha-D-glucosyltransferase/alpha-amylase
MPGWLRDTVFYEVYPQSFCDSNGDGIGDLRGITEKLDYIKGLGCGAVWINPCFDSPFRDAGYDVRDYKKVAPRYGTNTDLLRLFEEAHRRGMHILLDLVPGHTSEEHPWFRMSQRAERNEYSNRYIWTDGWYARPASLPFIAGEAEREAGYAVNFFKCQPALNYGFLKPEEPWQLPMDHPDCIATRAAMKEVMRFWLDRGCDGFRVDMASSLVKNDDARKSGTCAIWREIRRMLDADYPEAALIAEWSRPQLSLPAGFHCDFYLNSGDNGYGSLLRDYERSADGTDHSYFRRDSDGDILRFLPRYEADYLATKDIGYISLITCNHDTRRPRNSLTPEELKLAYAFLFTMPGVPFLYYGDEIGMRYQKLPTYEGGYFRTGSRTPMQWGGGKNLGFSAADRTYLPVDRAPDAPTVEAQEKDPDSLLNFTRRLLALRRAHPDLQADGGFSVLAARRGSRLFAYRRGGLVLAVNPGTAEESFPLYGDYRPLFTVGIVRAGGGRATLTGPAFAVLEPVRR